MFSIRLVANRQASEEGVWSQAGGGITDANGRIPALLEPTGALKAGIYRITFYVGEYFENQEHFYSEVTVQFLVRDPAVHYHVPLLLSPYGYTTYRGS
jgi:5-hydroxyisourate hydrolase